MKPGLEYGWRLPIWYLYPYPPPNRKYISANANAITGVTPHSSSEQPIMIQKC